MASHGNTRNSPRRNHGITRAADRSATTTPWNVAAAPQLDARIARSIPSSDERNAKTYGEHRCDGGRRRRAPGRKELRAVRHDLEDRLSDGDRRKPQQRSSPFERQLVALPGARRRSERSIASATTNVRARVEGIEKNTREQTRGDQPENASATTAPCRAKSWERSDNSNTRRAAVTATCCQSGEAAVAAASNESRRQQREHTQRDRDRQESGPGVYRSASRGQNHSHRTFAPPHVIVPDLERHHGPRRPRQP